MIDQSLLSEAKAGDVVAQVCLGNIYQKRSETRPDSKRLNHKKAAFWYHKAAEQGDPRAQFLLGLHYDYEDFEQAAVWYRKAAEQGESVAQFRLAELYEQGFGLPEDFAQAAFWYFHAAEQGNPDAQYCLAHAYANGRGVRKNYKQAVAWYRKGIENPDYSDRVVDGKLELGILFRDYIGDFAEAAVWFQKAAADGDLEALTNLADLYAGGLGVRLNRKQAVNWYRRAASLGNIGALVKLGDSYAEGKGVRKSVADAYYCFTLAAMEMDGEERATVDRKASMAERKLTPLELSKAKRRVKSHLLGVKKTQERRFLKLEEMRAKMGDHYISKPTRRRVLYRF